MAFWNSSFLFRRLNFTGFCVSCSYFGPGILAYEQINLTLFMGWFGLSVIGKHEQKKLQGVSFYFTRVCY